MNRKFYHGFIAFSVLFAFFLSGCKVQNEEMVPNSQELTEKHQINQLKTYLSEVSNADVNEINYNEKTEMFSISGIEQIDLKKLTEFYERNKNKVNDIQL